jgi:hypothetical protein
MQDIINETLMHNCKFYVVLDLVDKRKSAEGDTLVVLVKRMSTGALHTAELTGHGDTLAIARIQSAEETAEVLAH